MNTAARFRHLYEYEQDAHARVLASLAAVPAAQHATPEYRRALELIAHIEVARRFWLFRLGENEARPADFFPQVGDLAALAAHLTATEKKWAQYLARLADADLAREFTYQATEGAAYRNTVEEVLTQLYGHSLYHRGQIALLLRQLGCQPAETDYIFWCRKPANASSA